MHFEALMQIGARFNVFFFGIDVIFLFGIGSFDEVSGITSSSSRNVPYAVPFSIPLTAT